MSDAYLAHEKYDPPVPPRPEHMTSSSQKHRQLSQSLLRFIDREKPLEETKEVEHRQAVLRQLRRMIVQWIKDVWIGIGYPAEQAADLGGTLETSGSFRLGVNDPGGDIDTICIVPQHVSHADFFGLEGAQGPEGGFVGVLETTEGVEGIKAIPGAKVPLIKIDSFQGVEIDLLLAQLPLDRVPRDIDEEIDDESILNNVKFASLRALSGPRDNIRFDKLLEHVNADLREFQLFLRLVRHWAKSRGLWGNKYGYFGGVNCAILCIKVIQHFPNKKAASLLRLFFNIFSEYQWGPRRPVFISKVGMLDAEGSPKYPDLDPDLGFFQYPWQMPRGNRRDGHMPIVTPCYPVIDSMSKATRMSLRLFKQEFARGRDIIAKYMPSPKGVVLSFEEEDSKKTADAAAENASKTGDESAPAASATDSDVAGGTEDAAANDSEAASPGQESTASESKNPYDECAERLGAELYAPMCFPAHYKYYLEVNVSSQDEEWHKKWIGTISAQVRGLVEQLESTPALRKPLAMLHLWCKDFDLIVEGNDVSTAEAAAAAAAAKEAAEAAEATALGAVAAAAAAVEGALPPGHPPLPRDMPPPLPGHQMPPMGYNLPATHVLPPLPTGQGTQYDSQGNVLMPGAPPPKPPPPFKSCFLIGFRINRKFAPRPAEVRRSMVKKIKEWKEYLELQSYVDEYTQAGCEVDYSVLPRKGLPTSIIWKFGGQEVVDQEAERVEAEEAAAEAAAAEAERLAAEAAAEGVDGEEEDWEGEDEYYEEGAGGAEDGEDDEGVDEVDSAAMEAARARRALAHSALKMSQVLQAQLASAPDLAFAPSLDAEGEIDSNSTSSGAVSQPTTLRWRKRRIGKGSAPLSKLPRRRAIRVEL